MHIPPAEYYKNLPKKQLASGVLFFNVAGELLIVKPHYKDEWIVPGGVVEAFESPKAACEREVAEEIGLDVAIGRLVCIDYMVKDMPGTNDKRESIQMIFDGGTLTSEQINSIHLQVDELSEYKFVPLEEALQHFSPGFQKRIPFAIQARTAQSCVYLEQGEQL